MSQTVALGEGVRTVPGAARSASPRDFWKLWAGQSVSLVGDSFMVLAIPLFAVSVLHLSPAQAALTPFALRLPFLFLSLPAGALIDRRRRRPVMLACDAVQAAVFALFALLAWLRCLDFILLIGLLLIGGCAAVFFQVAYTTYPPSLIADPDSLHRANARLYLSESVSQTLGPVAAGPLVGMLGPMAAIAVNAGSFLLSLGAVLGITHREPRPARDPEDRGQMARNIRQGLVFARKHPLLEPVLSCGSIYVFYLSMLNASLVLYLHYSRGMSSEAVGLVLGLAGLGYPLGSMASKRMADQFGIPRALVISVVINVVGCAAMPVFGTTGWTAGLVLGGIMQGFANTVFGPISLTLRQQVTPPGLLARVNSVQRLLLWGMVPLGSLAASGLISLGGLGSALWTGGLGTALCIPALVRRDICKGLRSAGRTTR